jgi:hypothetical protein
MVLGYTIKRCTALGACATLACGLSSASASAQTRPAQGGERFIVIVDGNNPQRLFATGALDVVGTPVEVVSFDGGGGTDVVYAPGGTFKLTLLNTYYDPDVPQPGPCAEAYAGTGTYSIFDGTGAYTGVSGTGTTSFQGVFVPATCPGGPAVYQVDVGSGSDADSN